MDHLVAILRLRTRYPEHPDVADFPPLPGQDGSQQDQKSQDLLPRREYSLKHLEARRLLLREELKHFSLVLGQEVLNACQEGLEPLRHLASEELVLSGPYLHETAMLQRMLDDLIRINRVYGTCVLRVLEQEFSETETKATRLEYLELQDLGSLTSRYMEGLQLGIRYLDNLVCYEPLPGRPLLDATLEAELIGMLYRLQDLQVSQQQFLVLLERMQDDWLDLERQALFN